MLIVNLTVRALLRSPLKGLLGGVCELTYVGRRTGRTIRLPVQYSRGGDQLVAFAGRSAGKSWWRNFAEPQPVHVLVKGVDRAGTGRLVPVTDARWAAVAVVYERGHAAVDLSSDPLVVIDLDATATPDPRDAPVDVMARHPVASFIVLAYVLSWLCWLPLLADKRDWVSWSVSPYLHMAGELGLAAAALAVTGAIHGRAGVVALLERCVAWPGRLGWLGLAALGPLGLFAVALVAARVVDGTWPRVSHFGSSAEFSALPIAVYRAANLLFYG